MTESRMTRVVPELQPNTRYTLRLRRISRFNVASDWSEAIDFTTPATAYQPPLPRPLLYEGNTSMEIMSGQSALAQFVDGDLRAWPKENIVTSDNIHFSAPFHAPGTLRLDWNWTNGLGDAVIELIDKETSILVDKWEIPMITASGGTTVPMHYSPDYEWRLNVTPQDVATPLLANFNARVRLEGVETQLWNLMFETDVPTISTCFPIDGSQFLTINDYPATSRLNPDEILRQARIPGPQSNSVHWFDDCHFVTLIHNTDGIVSDGPTPKLILFEWWSIDEEANPLLEAYEEIDVSTLSINIGASGSVLSSPFVQTSDPDTVFVMGISSNPTINDVSDASLAEGFLVTRDAQVSHIGSVNLYSQQTINEIDAIVDLSSADEGVDVGALWLLETEHEDLFVGMFGVAWYFHGQDPPADQVHRVLFSVSVNVSAETFSSVDSEMFNDFSTMNSPGQPGYQQLRRDQVTEAHGVTAADGRLAMLSFVKGYNAAVGDTSSHYLDMVDYDGSGNFSARYREKADHLWRELHLERPDVDLFTYAVGGYGMPHATADRSHDLGSNKVLITTDHRIDYLGAAYWNESGGAWYLEETSQGPELGIHQHPKPKFGSVNPVPARLTEDNILAHFLLNTANKTVEWKGWPGIGSAARTDNPSADLIPTIPGVYTWGDSFVTDTPPDEMRYDPSWEVVVRYAGNKAIVAYQPWMYWDREPVIDPENGDIISPGWEGPAAFGPYVFGEFDISQIHQDGVYITGFDKEHNWWPDWEPSHYFVPQPSESLAYEGPNGNDRRYLPAWQHMSTLSPSGKLWWTYVEAYGARELLIGFGRFGSSGLMIWDEETDIWLAAIVDFDE